MKRPTIPDLAAAAGVSVSTVNRVLNQPDSVRLSTKERVLDAALELGFYGVGSIKQSAHAGRKTYRIGVLLQQKGRSFYRNLGNAIQSAAHNVSKDRVELPLEYLDDLSPERVADQIRALGEANDAVGLVAAQHPIVADAIDEVMNKGVPVTALIGPLYAKNNISFVGLDNWKVGRTAAWAFTKMTKEHGKLGILVGNHRYRNQELNESGFRSYFREHDPRFTLLEPLATYESAAAARDLVLDMMAKHPDLSGLFISGGGITGAVAALREGKTRNDFIAVGYELFDETRTALIDGTLTMIISHPLERLARETIGTLIQSVKLGMEPGSQRVALAFDLYTSENV